MNDTIKCPRCSHAFEPSALLRETLEKELRRKLSVENSKILAAQQKEFEVTLAANDAAMTKAAQEHAALLKRTRELEEAARTQALEVERQVAERLETVRASAASETKRRLALEAAEAARLKDEQLSDLREKLASATKGEAALAHEKAALQERARSLELDLERRLEDERATIRATAEADADARLARLAAETTRAKDQEIADAKRRLELAAQRESELVREKGVLEESQRRVQVEVERRVQEEARKARDSVMLEQAHEKALREAEHRQQLDEMSGKLQEMQRKVSQSSQQLHGEAQEIVLKDVLERAFAGDLIEDVEKGVEGGDLMQHVRDERGVDAGTLLWESKRTKAWSDAWLVKLRDDQRAAGAACAMLVTQAMPAGMASVGQRDGVWICTPAHAVALGTLVRQGVLAVTEVRRASLGRADKVQMVYDYLTGPQFKDRVTGAMLAFQEMQQDLAKEQSHTLSMWRRREKQMQRALRNLAEFHGDIRGIAGREIATIEAFELQEADLPPALPARPQPASDGILDSAPATASLCELLFELVPADGNVGNLTLLASFRTEALRTLQLTVGHAEFESCKEALILAGRLKRGKGRGGSVGRASDQAAE
jgi:hypothetical protein